MRNEIERMGKLWKPLTIMLLLTLAFVKVAPASPGDPTFTVVPEISIADVGETFTVEVYGYDLVGIYAWQVWIEWGTAVLDCTAVGFGDFLSDQPAGSTQVYNIQNDFGYASIGETTNGEHPGKNAETALLCTITFQVELDLGSELDISGYKAGPPEMYLTYYQDSNLNKFVPIRESGWFGGWPEDFNGDGIVDIFDLSSVAIHYGETGSPGWIPQDLSGPSNEPDGIIDIWDLTRVCLKYGQYVE